MTLATTTYQRKPLFVEVVQVTEENFLEIARWCQGDITNNHDETPVDANNTDAVDPKLQHIKVRVHNPMSVRQTKAFVGDWLLYTDKGYKIYTTKAFNKSFDPVNTAQQTLPVDDTSAHQAAVEELKSQAA